MSINEDNVQVGCTVPSHDIDPMYAFTHNPITALDKEFYDEIIARKGERILEREEILLPHTGDAYFLEAGQVIRIEQREATTQIVGAMFITPDLKQYGDNLNSFIFDAFPIDLYKRVWSQLKYSKPVATMVANEVPKDWVVVEDELICAHAWAAHCCPEWYEFAFGRQAALSNNCQVNFLQAVNKIPAVHAITDREERRRICGEIAENESIYLFRPSSWRGLADPRFGKSYPAPPLPKGTGVEFYAEQDTYVLLSNCPLGDQRASNILSNVSVPVYVSVYDTGIAPKAAYEVYNWEDEFYNMVANGEKDICVKNDR